MFENFNSQETPVGRTGNHRRETTALMLKKTDLLGNTEDQIRTTSVILRTTDQFNNILESTLQDRALVTHRNTLQTRSDLCIPINELRGLVPKWFIHVLYL
jgi:hypothetical protein